jgi:hypothetical protein
MSSVVVSNNLRGRDGDSESVPQADSQHQDL